MLKIHYKLHYTNIMSVMMLESIDNFEMIENKYNFHVRFNMRLSIN